MKFSPKTFHKFYSIALFYVFSALSSLSFSQALLQAVTYSNEEVGVQISFEQGWSLSTSYENAPAILKAAFRQDKGPNESPLFIAQHESQQLFSRLLIEPFYADLESYIVLLGQNLSAQGMEVSSAKMSVEGDAAEIVYIQPQLSLVYKERIALLDSSRVIRMGVWSSQAVYTDFTVQIETLFEQVQLSKIIMAEDSAQALWAQLDSRLLANNISGINISQAREQSVAALDCANPESSMLWQVNMADDSAVEVFLFGSLHVGKAEFYPLNERIETAFRESDHLVFEVDPASVNDPEIVRSIQAKGMFSDGQSLDDVVSADTISNLQRVLGNINVPIEPFLNMKPWLLTVVLSSLQINALGYSPQHGIESYLLAQNSAGSDILELESIEQQVEFLQQMNSEVFLNYALADFEGGDELIIEMIHAWQCGDKQQLSNIIFEDLELKESATLEEKAELEEMRELLFFKRNITMAEGIKTFLEEGSGDYFVVVGSGHLLGERSVIELLIADGYQITPVNLSP